MRSWDAEMRGSEPLPGAIRPKWVGVIGEPPTTDMKAKLVKAPGTDTLDAAYSRIHELMHVKHTPHKTPKELCELFGIEFAESLQVAEDIRIGRLLREADTTGHVKDAIRAHQRPQNIQELSSVYNQAHYAFGDIRSGLFPNRDDEDAADLTPRLAKRAVLRWLVFHMLPTVGTAAWGAGYLMLQDAIRDLKEMDPCPVEILGLLANLASDVRTFAMATCHRGYAKNTFKRTTVPLAKLVDQILQRWMDGAAAMGKLTAPPSSRPWGEMATVELDMPESCQATRKLMRRRPADRGTIPRLMQRWCSDQQIFTTKTYHRGASILIDASGSMSISSQEIAEFVAKYPASIVAYYSGSGGCGTLAIAAKDGRCATRLPRFGGGNIVDGPAAAWLAAQPGPRFWITDCGFTGIGDLLTDPTGVHKFTKQHKITYVRSMREIANGHIG